ncbi:prepilin-type N-terminal cleavage/methylation domain-containing protein [Lactobacillus curvatus]|uniref:competence type IV pilus major pilin ComGC n=1 Tax=Latilactobacillus fragifolii TaxID=2814244 RepID=UPI0012AFC49F|nr:competence type IV pilus major pilin ComGC [Latilactobacillus fragifolii]MSD83306.1 prepilin-type N-terminal cleavage/methylation domain-containing protein [Latilactobacillus curvatus]MSE23497.1 prepilin-type N-terminal cleavage/methylation domain-containing protein [Latilactobacillus curvatus]
MKKKRKAFTLIEMVVVLAVISMLVLLIAPNLMRQKEAAEKKTDTALVATIQTQVELARDDGKTVSSLADLASGEKYLSDNQVKQAEKRGITIKDNKVVQNSK